MGIYYKNNFEFEIRDIGGSDVYYKRNIGDDIWLFSTKEEFELNKNIMDKKYSESAIEKGTEIEMEHAETIKKFMRDGVSVKEVARAIAIDHLEESPTYYQDLKEEYAKGGGVNEEKIPTDFISKYNTYKQEIPYILVFQKYNYGIYTYLETETYTKKGNFNQGNRQFYKDVKKYGVFKFDNNELVKVRVNINKLSVAKEIIENDKKNNTDINFENGGSIKKENLARIYCHNPKCNWNWSVESGGDDLYICHKCFTDNEKFYEKGGLIAPNGKTSKLTPEQYKLVRTSEFKEWFGDWEKDPANASKVVDENGEPLVVYHGSRQVNENTKFDIFNIGDGAYGKGVYFTSDKKESIGWALGNYVYEVFLNVKNPFVENNYRKWFPHKTESSDFDGIIQMDLQDVSMVVTFNPNQIKLADGTNTTFYGKNPDIRFEDGGEANAISDIIIELKNKYLNEYGIESCDINKGECYNFSEELLGILLKNGYNDAQILTTELFRDMADEFQKQDDDEIFYNPLDYGGKRPINFIEKFYAHSWVFVNGKHYDSDAPYGVENFYDLIVVLEDGRFNDGGSVLLAPNGKPSNLTPEQHKLVRTPAFKKWFGDWENEPENSSKVVDANGEPKPQYHFTDNKFTKFKFKESGFHFGDKSIRDDLSIAKGQNLSIEINAFLNIKNPLRIDDMSRFTPDKITEQLSDKGIISDEKFDELQQIYYELDDDEDSLTKQSNKLIKAMDDLGYDGFIYENQFDSQDSKISYLIDDSSSKIYIRNDMGVFKGDVILLSDSDRKPFLVFTDLNENEYAVVNNEGEELTLVDKIKIKNMLNSDYYISVVNSPKTHKDYDLFLSDKLFLDSWIAFNPNQIKLADGTNTTFNGNNSDIRFDGGGEVEDLINQGIVELKMFDTKPEHAKEYGLDAINPLYVQSLNVNENKRLKGVGKKVLQYIDDYAIKNGHDVVFGHINKKATMNKDNRTGYFTVFTDIDYIKHWLFRNGYSVNQENNDFHKVVMSDSKDINDESKSDINFADGGSVVNDKLVALHNINSKEIISADKLGGLITPSIAILKAGDKFTDFGSITLIADKNLINPQNYDTRVFAGDVYSPTVPRKNIYVDKKKYDNVTLKLINKSFEYDKSKEVYNIAQNLLSDYNSFYKDLGKLSFEDLNKNYSDKMRIIYLVDKDIPVKIPMKESRHILWNNVEFTLTEEQKKRFKPVLDEYRKQSNDSNLSKEIKSEVYDLMLEVLDDIRRDLKEKYKENTDRYEILKDSLKKSFEDYVGERYTFGHSPVYNLSEAVFGRKELNENQLNINIYKVFTKSLKEDYKQWLSDFISQFRGYAYFLKGTQKIPYTLDNLVDATSNAVVGQEKNMTFGVNQAKSFATKEFKTIDEMKKKSNVLITKEEMNVVDKENSDKFFQVADELKYVYSDSWNKLDSLGKALADYFKGKSVYNALVKNDFKSPNSFQEDSFLELANQLKNAPVDYFEAKLGRAVKLSEFKYAVVPYETEKQVLDILKKNDLKIKKYKTEEERIMVTKDILNKDKKITFEDGGKIQLNSNRGKVNLKLSNYEDVTELVPVSELLKLREFNRYERPKYSLDDSKDNISKLEDELVNNGVEEPLIIEYSLADNSVLLIEGNHRLNVADNLGFDYLPARVVLRRREFSPLQKTKAFKVKGFTPDKYGYVPSDLKPSQVGIGGTTKAFEDGGIVEGQLHSECNDETGCGEKYDVGGVGHIIEVERDEAVIVSKAFQDNNEYEIKGTLSEIASALNVLGDGKNFDSGAEIKSEDGKKVEVSEIKKEAKNTDVETINPNSIIINRRSMYDEKEYVAKGTPKQIASQINNINDNGVKIVDGGSIKKT